MRDHFQGTLPYMSINLLTRWTEGNRIYHNPNDDLESGVWVGMIRGLEQSVKYGATKKEKSWLTDLLAHNAKVISLAKHQIRELDRRWASNPPEAVHAFYGLIVKWLGLLLDRADKDGSGTKGSISMERYLGSYQEFLCVGFTWLQMHEVELREDWRHFFSSQKDKGAISADW